MFVVLKLWGLFMGSMLSAGLNGPCGVGSIASMLSCTTGTSTGPRNCGDDAGFGGSLLTIFITSVSPPRTSNIGPTVLPLYVRPRSLYPAMLVVAYRTLSTLTREPSDRRSPPGTSEEPPRPPRPDEQASVASTDATAAVEIDVTIK